MKSWKECLSFRTHDRIFATFCCFSRFFRSHSTHLIEFLIQNYPSSYSTNFCSSTDQWIFKSQSFQLTINQKTKRSNFQQFKFMCLSDENSLPTRFSPSSSCSSAFFFFFFRQGFQIESEQSCVPSNIHFYLLVEFLPARVAHSA